MAAKLVHSPIPAPSVGPTMFIITNLMRTPRAFSTTDTSNKKNNRIKQQSNGSRLISTIRVAEQTSTVVGDDDEETKGSLNCKTAAQVKSELFDILQGINRGIFGVPTEKKSEIENLVKFLESQNPTPDPTQNLEKVAGSWTLLYSTIRILGSKRTKLGLRDFISLADFLQIIDVAEGKAVNVIKFNARGLNLLNGKLTIEATFKVASKSRVDISYRNSTITPDQLMNLFRKNYDVLLGIFNPEGWLEITILEPKRGFHNPFSLTFQTVGLGKIAKLINAGKMDSSELITMKTLKEAGAIGKQIRDGVRLMGRGAEHIQWPIHLEVTRVTVRAKAAVEAAGGYVRKVYYNKLGFRALLKPEWFEKKGRLLPRAARPPPKQADKVDSIGRLLAPTKPIPFTAEEKEAMSSPAV